MVRISISKEDGKELSTQERLRLVEDELAKMRQNLVEVTRTVAEVIQTVAGAERTNEEVKQTVAEVNQAVTEVKQTLGKLVERSEEWSQGGLLAKGDLQTGANEAVKYAEGV